MLNLLLRPWLTAGIIAAACAAPAAAQETPKFVPGKIVIYYRSTDDRDAALRDMTDATLRRMLSTRLRVRGENAAGAQVEKNPDNSLVLSVELFDPPQGQDQDQPGPGAEAARGNCAPGPTGRPQDIARHAYCPRFRYRPAQAQAAL